MAIKVKHHKNEAEIKARIETLLVEISKEHSVEKEKELLSLYEKWTNFNPGCPPCIAGRSLFAKGIKALVSGEVNEGLASMKGAMKSVGSKVDWMKAKRGIEG